MNNRNKYNFKVGIARIFNSTGPKQKKGNFVPDMILKMKNINKIKNINQYRDFIHIDDVSKSIKRLVEREIEYPINISSGQKINLINACKILNDKFVKKEVLFDLKKGSDIYGDNSLLKKIGIKKFKNIYQILSAYKK